MEWSWNSQKKKGFEKKKYLYVYLYIYIYMVPGGGGVKISKFIFPSLLVSWFDQFKDRLSHQNGPNLLG